MLRRSWQISDAAGADYKFNKLVKVKVIKIGGKLIENDKILDCLCEKLTVYHPGCVLVHGGGSMAGQLSSRLGIETRMYEGRRITDLETLEVTVMAYAGLANKKVVACLQSKGVNACGLSGCDMGIVMSHKRKDASMDWGFVGDIDAVKAEALALLLEKGIMPVISPITYSREGQLLNTNADSVASAVAVALSGRYETELVYCFDKPGVLRDVEDGTSVIPEINEKRYTGLKSEGIIHSGMLPKLENAFKTLKGGVKAVRLCSPGDLEGGTVIVR